ncbi:GGDEF domain-containing protein [Tropicibacter naphthalenivorans]|uniref:Cyclic di-GMP phosphodiesterase Gmr n=1 Tax=Tropicibacter naphthalenivorans TaxID=441103 RepID=A0A0P1GKB8_9RHOB|nr:GGDEF domain-containing protein [Tropicibacter naphthalenivorans]CUH82459.1 Cyclic di-GMP phosphodiesterase Gmr [Tropicibacter naphthalenivorans]SMD06000.1 diguanylate cyclase (GGDEF) domain-containing protein [Tropicibacter naphthalenivorans]
MTRLPEEMLHNLCPMHAVLDETGHIRQAGPTLHKLSLDRLEGARFLEVFEVYRPRAVDSMPQLLQTEGRKLHIRLRGGVRTPLKGVLVSDGQGGAVVNLSFGIAVMDAVRDYALTSTDFAPTDLAIEMLYLVEAKSAAMDASRSLNTRLQGAMVAAEERAFTDTLTGLRNRRAMDSVMERLVRSGHAFSIMHIDLDFFKQVNDTMGHAAGDHVLKHVARVMNDETRAEDTVARVGGDEFVIIFGNLTSRRRLAELAGRIIERIEKPVMYEGRECRVSASVGIAISQVHGQDPFELIERADQALYASKRAGRAQFRFYDGSDGPDETLGKVAVGNE